MRGVSGAEDDRVTALEGVAQQDLRGAAAKPLGNHTQCPSYGTELPKWSGTHAIDDDEPYSPLSTTKGTISTNLSHTAPSTANQSFAKHDD